MGRADRAVAVALHEHHVLVIRRHREGRNYCVLPGGGVEPGEAPVEASLRELREETGLVGCVDRHLWTLDHEDRVAHYFLVSVGLGPMILGGPELVAQSPDNSYAPQWIPMRSPVLEKLEPAEVRPLLNALSRASWPRRLQRADA